MIQDIQPSVLARGGKLIFSYTEEAIKELILRHFLITQDEGLPEHFVTDVEFSVKNEASERRVNVYVR